MQTVGGEGILIKKSSGVNLLEIMKEHRGVVEENERIFFRPEISDLHDPYLLPDMENAVNRILRAQEQKERIVIFGDYDVDGVSSTAILVKFLSEIGCEVSYRLPHRVHDGYGLKEYFFDELAEKGVTLVVTVDCGTRDIGPIRHAKTLGIDVIITDHHAVPDVIPEEVIAIVNPKRKDSLYPFHGLAGAGVAFKLLHGVIQKMKEIGICHRDKGSDPENNNTIHNDWIASCLAMTDQKYLESTLTRYIDFASLGTVADCMPITGENRIITTLGLRQMQKSESVGLRNFLEGHDQIEGNADIIGFQIGPRINAAGRMDTPLTALRWLLAGEGRTDEFFGELEHLNETRKGTTEIHFQKALENIDTSKPVLFYDASDLEHGIIGLVAGRLTEMYNKPTIVIKNGHDHPLTSRKGDTVSVDDNSKNDITDTANLSIASCRSPEWCNLIELLDHCRDFFVRYGGHRQAAGFTIETTKIESFKEAIWNKMAMIHDIENLPKKIIEVECVLGSDDINEKTLEIIDQFRPFGIGNPKPLFLLENITITECGFLGKGEKHLVLKCLEYKNLRMIFWNASDRKTLLDVGNIISLIVELDKNEWNGKVSVQAIVRHIMA